MAQLWFSIYDFSFDYRGEEPPVIEPVNFDWAKEIQVNADTIREELFAFLQSRNLQSYFNSKMVSKPKSWKTISLKWWNLRIYKHQKHFPFTNSLINKFPSIVSCSFNLLEPGSRILPHCGDTNAIYRCHFGLEVPAGLPDCGFKVKDQVRAWKNNEWLVFMDAYVHEAWNNTDKERYILVVDVIREEFIPQKKKICSTVLSSLMLQKIGERVKFIYKLKPGMIGFLARCLNPFARIGAGAANFFRVY